MAQVQKVSKGGRCLRRCVFRSPSEKNTYARKAGKPNKKSGSKKGNFAFTSRYEQLVEIIKAEMKAVEGAKTLALAAGD